MNQTSKSHSEWHQLACQSILGHRVQIAPMSIDLLDETYHALTPDIDGWYSVMFGLNSRESYKKEFEDADSFYQKQSGVGFCIQDIQSKQICGISFFLNMNFENKSLEVGTTNIAPKFRKTYVNTETKYLMLKKAFEELNCIRVVFRIDQENYISRTAIERLGAKYGGLLRNERILPDSRIRDYCHYTIIQSEWPSVKQMLELKLQ